MINITKRSGSTCFVCKMARSRNIGMRMIELATWGRLFWIGQLAEPSDTAIRYHFEISGDDR
jgi:hypothetical protein